MVMIMCETSKKGFQVGNTPHMCAERRLIQYLKHRSRIEGVQRSTFYHWVHRKLGELVIMRRKCDGNLGTSVPCVCCRKVLDHGCIRWKAHIGDAWFSSHGDSVPVSKPTQKQRGIFNGTGRQRYATHL